MKIFTMNDGSKKIDFDNDLVISTEGIDITESRFIAGVRNSKLEVCNMSMIVINRRHFKSKLHTSWIALKYIWTGSKK